MAEGSDLPSVKDGSDADFEFTCTPCGEDNIREEAVKYCHECQEYLCVTCTRCHSRTKASRSHKLLDRNDATKGSVVAKTTKCRYHPDRDTEMYCGAHDMVYCAKCIATEHRSCSGVVGIEEVDTSNVQENDIKRLQDETSDVQERLVVVDIKTQKNLESLEEQRNAILDQVQETERNLIEHIRKLKANTTDALNKHYTDIRDNLKSDITGLDDAKKELEKSRNQLDMVIHSDAGQQFVQLKLIQSTVADAKKLIEKNESNGIRSVSFTENTDLKTSIITAQSLGQANATSKTEINVKMESDNQTCYITGVCQLQDGSIILTDWGNKKIKMLDTDYKLQDQCALDSFARGICCTGQNEVAVKMCNNTIQFMSVGTSLSKLRVISIAGGNKWGMAYFGGELWVSTGTAVNVYSTSGALLKSINKDVNGQNIFKGEIRYMAVLGDTLVITYKTGAVCLRNDGTVKQEFKDERLVGVCGASISNSGAVFLSGSSSNNIMMFRLDGKCLREVVSKDDGLIEPVALCYDNKSNCLIVACASSNTIHIFMFD